MNPPQIPAPNDPDDTDSDWSALEAIILQYQRQAFTLLRFAQIQRDLFATGLLQNGDQKWGVEFIARPETPRFGIIRPRSLKATDALLDRVPTACPASDPARCRSGCSGCS